MSIAFLDFLWAFGLLIFLLVVIAFFLIFLFSCALLFLLLSFLDHLLAFNLVFLFLQITLFSRFDCVSRNDELKVMVLSLSHTPAAAFDAYDPLFFVQLKLREADIVSPSKLERLKLLRLQQHRACHRIKPQTK